MRKHGFGIQQSTVPKVNDLDSLPGSISALGEKGRKVYMSANVYLHKFYINFLTAL